MWPEDEEEVGEPYAVGYKHPPREHQFKRGNKVGAGKRRPRRAKLVDETIRKIAEEKVEVTVDGRRVRMSLMEALLRDLFLNKRKQPKDTLRVIELIKQSELATENQVQPQTITVEFVKSRPRGLPGALPEDQ